MPKKLPVVERIQEQITEFQRELSVDIPRQLEEARAHGDLSENAEYEAAKDRQGLIQARIGHLSERLANLSHYNLSSIPHGVVGYGSMVWVEDCDSGERANYEVVFPEEADPAEGRISLVSPLGQALLKHSEGDEVYFDAPSGRRNLEIVSVKTIHERG
ncbi:MAG: transcription elongation factor GreA [Deltaproteobacteria bacterium]